MSLYNEYSHDPDLHDIEDRLDVHGCRNLFICVLLFWALFGTLLYFLLR